MTIIKSNSLHTPLVKSLVRSQSRGELEFWDLKGITGLISGNLAVHRQILSNTVRLSAFVEPWSWLTLNNRWHFSFYLFIISFMICFSNLMQRCNSSASLINLDIVLRIQPRDLKTRSSDCPTRNEWFRRIILRKMSVGNQTWNNPEIEWNHLLCISECNYPMWRYICQKWRFVNY